MIEAYIIKHLRNYIKFINLVIIWQTNSVVISSAKEKKHIFAYMFNLMLKVIKNIEPVDKIDNFELEKSYFLLYFLT